MTTLIQIDGSQGEGGGQILRSSLALSAATGQPFRISRIRAGRQKPGLMRQHLTCVSAAQAICAAEVTGAAVGSQELEFRPSKVRSGDYTFTIGTAGATALVLQAILPPLLIASARSTIAVEGGTHAKGAPSFDFLERSLVPLLNRMGAKVTARIDRHGFYPAGGGRIVMEVEPASRLCGFELHERGQTVSRAARVFVSKLPGSIAFRELEAIRSRLNWEVSERDIVHPSPAFGPGNAVVLDVVSEHVTDVFSAFGEMGRSAELVATDAADQVREYLACGAPVGPHLADQLMVPMALAGAGSFTTCPLSSHVTTNADVIRAFLPARIRTEGEKRITWSIEV